MLGGISIWQLLIILVIVLLLFGTKKLRNLGGDLGSALKNFRSAMKEGEDEDRKEEQHTAQVAHSKDEENAQPSTQAETKDKKSA